VKFSEALRSPKILVSFSFKKTITLYSGGIRSHDPQLQSVEGGDGITTIPRRQGTEELI
jgi:hypothetical protein